MMLIVEAIVPLQITEDSPPAYIRATLQKMLPAIASIIENSRCRWFYTLTSLKGIEYLRQTKERQRHNDSTSVLIPSLTYSQEQERFADLLPRDTSLNLLLNLYALSGKVDQLALREALEQLGARDVTFFRDPSSMIVTSSNNGRHLTAALDISANISCIAMDIILNKRDVYTQGVHRIYYLLKNYELMTGMDVLSANISYRMAYIDNNQVHHEISNALKKLTDSYDVDSIAQEDHIARSTVWPAIDNVCQAAQRTNVPLLKNMILPIHWLCNNAAIRIGQELLILRFISILRHNKYV